MANAVLCCDNCGKEGASLKKCSICKQTWYCGGECQKVGWKKHKKTCTPPVRPQTVYRNVCAASTAADWREVLKWESRLDDMIKNQTDACCELGIRLFARAHMMAGEVELARRTHHALAVVR